MKRLTKKIISGSLALSLVLGCMVTVSGCGAKEETKTSQNIELLDPVVTGEASVTAEYRNIYSAVVYPAIVCPSVTEYSFDKGLTFSKYGAMPGETVAAGDAIIYGATESVDEQIKNKKESIADMEESHSETLEDMYKPLYDARAREKELSGILESMEKEAPNQYWYDENGAIVTDAHGNDMENPDYITWHREYEIYEKEYRYAKLELEQLELNQKKENELYALDYKYQKQKLADLNNTRNEVVLKSGVAGNVVAVQYFQSISAYYWEDKSYDWISKNVSVAAVGDFSVKEIRCEFVSLGKIRKAEDVYFLIDGERYEANYQAIDSTEYDRLYDKNGVVYSTFLLDDPENKVKTGSYALLVIVEAARENTLCVPKDAIKKGEDGDIVYVYDGKNYTATSVRVGVTDSLYAEILSGVEAGDLVKSDMSYTYGSNTAQVSHGDVCSNFKENGYLFYPSTSWIKNPIEYGTVYVDQICVSQYQQVEKGQVIAKVHVVADTIEIARNERKLLREQQSNKKLVDNNVDGKNDRAIKNSNKRIQEYTELINKMKSDAATTEIVATANGIITDITTKKVGDLIYYDTKLAQIADEAQLYIVVEDSDGRLSYGNKVNVEYKDNNGATKVAEGTVVTVNQMALSKDLTSGYSLVQLPTEQIAEMAGSTMNSDGWWSRSTFKVTAEIRSMKNVVTVPKKAVKDVSGTTYVMVRDADGTVRRVSFIAGGSDQDNYWVVEGLTEGMTVCLE